MLLFVIQCIGNGETFWQWMAGKSTTGKYWNRENDNLLTAFSFCLSILEQIRLCFKIEKQIFGTWKCDILLYQFFTLQFNYTPTFRLRNLILNSFQYLDSEGVWTEVIHSKSYILFWGRNVIFFLKERLGTSVFFPLESRFLACRLKKASSGSTESSLLFSSC